MNAPDFNVAQWRAVSDVEKALAPRGAPVSNSKELQRIIDLPRRQVVTKNSPTAEALIEMGMQKYSRGPRECRCGEIDRQIKDGRRSCIKRFKWEQAWMLYEIGWVGGLIANCPVGAGKTVVNFLSLLALRDHAWRNGTDCALGVLLVPPSLLGQIKHNYQLIAEHFRVPGVVIHLPGKKVWRREPQPVPGLPNVLEPVLHIISYNALSGTENSDWLERLGPNALIADEVDALKDMNSSRTMRVMRLFEKYEATTRFCGWTGSLTDNSIREMAHLSCLALRLGSPLPTLRKIIDEWSACLDAVPNPTPVGALIRLLEPGEGTHEIRHALRRRLSQTPGFIMIEGRQIITIPGTDQKVKVDVSERQAPPIPPKILEALRKIRNHIRPDTMVGGEADEVIVERVERAAYARQVASGMLLRWVFPRGEPSWLKRDWFAARKEWHSELRSKMLRGEVGLDSRKLCEDAAMRAWGFAPRAQHLAEWRAESLPAWMQIKDQVVPKPQAERLDSFIVDDAAQWSVENRGILWYQMKEFSTWLAQRAFELYGVRIPIYGEGSGEDIINNENGSRSIIASLKSHGRGRDGLQFMFNRQLVAQSPANARGWQQLLGRLHRDGQRNDQIITEIYLHTDELEASFDQAVLKGNYVEAVTGEKQKLLDGWEDRDIE
jgi:hypothetical protein